MPRISPTLPLVVPALLALLSVAGGAQAQTITSPYSFIETRHEVTVFGGVAGENRGTIELGPGGGPLIGVRYGLALTGTAGIEAALQYIAADRNVYDPTGDGEEPEFLELVDHHIALLEARGRFSLTGGRTWHGLAPYVFGGGGLAMSLSGSTDAEEEFGAGSKFTFGPTLTGTVGGGIRWHFGERLGAGLEGSLNLWKIGNPAAFRTFEESLGPVPEDEWTGWSAVTVGVSYRF
ncbi:MAG: hypothetical protein WD056_01740 [Gemmatimonadota bacterium]